MRHALPLGSRFAIALFLTTFAARSGAAADGPTLHTVTRGEFKVRVELSGVFESSETHEIFVRPEAWKTLEVADAIEHGARVAEGEVLLRLDRAELEEAIESLEHDVRLSELSVKQAQEELHFMEIERPLALDVARRGREHEAQDLLRFLEIERPLLEKDAREDVENARQSLSYESEELAQLEKMYKEDDLTEETEEIILERQRHEVRRAKFALERIEKASERTLENALPRREDDLKTGLRRTGIELERQERAVERELERKRIEIDKLRLGLERSQQRLERLRADLERMEVRAPAGGIVYYGRATRGQWPAVASLAAGLSRGGTVRPNDVVMTVVDPAALFVRVTVPEASLGRLEPGVEGTATLASDDTRRLEAKLEAISRVPVAPGSFDARVAVGDGLDGVVPGMACSLSFTTYERKDAIAVPEACVRDDGGDGNHVLVDGGNGVTERRTVRVGRRHGGRVEILDGLEGGEKILVGGDS